MVHDQFQCHQPLQRILEIIQIVVVFPLSCQIIAFPVARHRAPPLPRRHLDPLILLNPQTHVLARPRPGRIAEGEVEVAEQLDKHLVQLDHGHLSAQALILAVSPDQLARPQHAVIPVPLGVEPALGAEVVGIGTEDGSGAVHAPRVVSDLGPAWDEDGLVGAGEGDGVALRQGDLGEGAGDGRVDAHALLDDGLEVGQGAGFGVGDDGTGDFPGVDGIVDFGLQAFVGDGVAHEIEHGGADDGGARVRAGEDLEERFGNEGMLGHAVLDEGSQHVLALHGFGPETLADELLGEGNETADSRAVLFGWKQEFGYPLDLQNVVEDGNGSKENDDFEHLLRRLDIFIHIVVFDKITQRLAVRDVGDDVQGEVLDFAAKVHWSYLVLGGDVFAPDEVDKILDVAVD